MERQAHDCRATSSMEIVEEEFAEAGQSRTRHLPAGYLCGFDAGLPRRCPAASQALIYRPELGAGGVHPGFANEILAGLFGGAVGSQGSFLLLRCALPYHPLSDASVSAPVTTAGYGSPRA